MSAAKNGDKVALLLFTDEVELFVPPRKGRRHILRLVREMLMFQPKKRATDISRLAARMLAFFAGHAGKPATALSEEASAALEQHPWPGNLRELRNVIERAVILSSGDSIGVADLSESVQPTSEMRLGGRFTLEAIENEHIRGVIATTRSLDEAAEVLGIDPATLYRRRRKLAPQAPS